MSNYSRERTILLYYPTPQEYKACFKDKSDEEALEEYGKHQMAINYMVKNINDALDILNTHYNNRCNRGNVAFKVKLIYYPDYTHLDDLERDSVRICIGFGNMQKPQDELIKLFDGAIGDISHVVCLVTDENISKYKWEQKTFAPFNAIITSSVTYMKYIIFSIVYDIILYNSYGLPRKAEYRKAFSSIKNAFIKSENKVAYIGDIYGQADIDEDVYLPISLETILKASKENLDLVKMVNHIHGENLDRDLLDIFTRLILSEFEKHTVEGIFTYYLPTEHTHVKERIDEAKKAIGRRAKGQPPQLFCLSLSDVDTDGDKIDDFDYFTLVSESVLRCEESIFKDKFAEIAHFLPDYAFFTLKEGQ